MKYISAKIVQTADKKGDNRRFRNILANSGLPMEDNDVRDLDHLYVMGRDRKLIKISDLAANPDKQKEKYKVNFATDHGHTDLATGERVVETDDIIGDAKVWMKDGELMARVYFADNDEKADHAYAISDNASYSIGTQWYEDGYYGAGNEIDGIVGILREISMVNTGNDPRAQTLDHKPADSKAQRGDDAVDGKNNTNERKKMKKHKDELTPEEAKAFTDEISAVVDKYTAGDISDLPEIESKDEKDEKDEADKKAETTEDKKEEETAPTESKDMLHRPVVVIRDRAVKQEKAATKQDWLHSKEGHVAFADTLRKAGGFNNQFHAAWRDTLTKHMNMDGITGLPTPAPVEQMFATAIEKSDGIISHFRMINAKSYRSHILVPTSDEGGRAKAHAKGETKDNQDLTDHTRDFLAKMVYKKLDIDATELWENPELIDIRAQELVDAIVVEIERAGVVGDGRTGKKSLFESPRGFYSVLADAKDNEGQGKYTATLLQPQDADWDLYEAAINAKSLIKTTGDVFAIAKSSVVAAQLLEKTTSGNFVVAPGTEIEKLLQVTRVYTPAWMNGIEDCDVIFLVDQAYAMIGDSQIHTRADFDTSNNTDILLDETPRGGGLDKYMAAVAVKLAKAGE